MIAAPFTAEQRRRLVDWQVAARSHPFTCPNDGRSLVPLDRWVCSACDYEQSWAHAFMVEEDVDVERQRVRAAPRGLRDLREGELRVETERPVGGPPAGAERG